MERRSVESSENDVRIACSVSSSAFSAGEGEPSASTGPLQDLHPFPYSSAQIPWDQPRHRCVSHSDFNGKEEGLALEAGLAPPSPSPSPRNLNVSDSPACCTQGAFSSDLRFQGDHAESVGAATDEGGEAFQSTTAAEGEMLPQSAESKTGEESSRAELEESDAEILRAVCLEGVEEDWRQRWAEVPTRRKAEPSEESGLSRPRKMEDFRSTGAAGGQCEENRVDEHDSSLCRQTDREGSSSGFKNALFGNEAEHKLSIGRCVEAAGIVCVSAEGFSPSDRGGPASQIETRNCAREDRPATDGASLAREISPSFALEFSSLSSYSSCCASSSPAASCCPEGDGRDRLRIQAPVDCAEDHGGSDSDLVVSSPPSRLQGWRAESLELAMAVDSDVAWDLESHSHRRESDDKLDRCCVSSPQNLSVPLSAGAAQERRIEAQVVCDLDRQDFHLLSEIKNPSDDTSRTVSVEGRADSSPRKLKSLPHESPAEEAAECCRDTTERNCNESGGDPSEEEEFERLLQYYPAPRPEDPHYQHLKCLIYLHFMSYVDRGFCGEEGCVDLSPGCPFVFDLDDSRRMTFGTRSLLELVANLLQRHGAAAVEALMAFVAVPLAFTHFVQCHVWRSNDNAIPVDTLRGIDGSGASLGTCVRVAASEDGELSSEADSEDCSRCCTVFNGEQKTTPPGTEREPKMMRNARPRRAPLRPIPCCCFHRSKAAAPAAVALRGCVDCLPAAFPSTLRRLLPHQIILPKEEVSTCQHCNFDERDRLRCCSSFGFSRREIARRSYTVYDFLISCLGEYVFAFPANDSPLACMRMASLNGAVFRPRPLSPVGGVSQTSVDGNALFEALLRNFAGVAVNALLQGLHPATCSSASNPYHINKLVELFLFARGGSIDPLPLHVVQGPEVQVAAAMDAQKRRRKEAMAALGLKREEMELNQHTLHPLPQARDEVVFSAPSELSDFVCLAGDGIGDPCISDPSYFDMRRAGFRGDALGDTSGSEKCISLTRVLQHLLMTLCFPSSQELLLRIVGSSSAGSSPISAAVLDCLLLGCRWKKLLTFFLSPASLERRIDAALASAEALWRRGDSFDLLGRARTTRMSQKRAGSEPRASGRNISRASLGLRSFQTTRRKLITSGRWNAALDCATLNSQSPLSTLRLSEAGLVAVRSRAARCSIRALLQTEAVRSVQFKRKTCECPPGSLLPTTGERRSGQGPSQAGEVSGENATFARRRKKAARSAPPWVLEDSLGDGRCSDRAGSSPSETKDEFPKRHLDMLGGEGSADVAEEGGTFENGWNLDLAEETSLASESLSPSESVNPVSQKGDKAAVESSLPGNAFCLARGEKETAPANTLRSADSSCSEFASKHRRRHFRRLRKEQPFLFLSDSEAPPPSPSLSVFPSAHEKCYCSNCEGATEAASFWPFHFSVWILYINRRRRDSCKLRCTARRPPAFCQSLGVSGEDGDLREFRQFEEVQSAGGCCCAASSASSSCSEGSRVNSTGSGFMRETSASTRRALRRQKSCQVRTLTGCFSETELQQSLLPNVLKATCAEWTSLNPIYFLTLEDISPLLQRILDAAYKHPGCRPPGCTGVNVPRPGVSEAQFQTWLQQRLAEGVTDMAMVYDDPSMEMQFHKHLLKTTFVESGIVSALAQCVVRGQSVSSSVSLLTAIVRHALPLKCLSVFQDAISAQFMESPGPLVNALLGAIPSTETSRLGLAFLNGVECLQQLALCNSTILDFVSASRWKSLLDIFLHRRRQQIFTAKILVILKVALDEGSPALLRRLFVDCRLLDSLDSAVTAFRKRRASKKCPSEGLGPVVDVLLHLQCLVKQRAAPAESSSWLSPLSSTFTTPRTTPRNGALQQPLLASQLHHSLTLKLASPRGAEDADGDLQAEEDATTLDPQAPSSGSAALAVPVQTASSPTPALFLSGCSSHETEFLLPSLEVSVGRTGAATSSFSLSSSRASCSFCSCSCSCSCACASPSSPSPSSSPSASSSPCFCSSCPACACSSCLHTLPTAPLAGAQPASLAEVSAEALSAGAYESSVSSTRPSVSSARPIVSSTRPGQLSVCAVSSEAPEDDAGQSVKLKPALLLPSQTPTEETSERSVSPRGDLQVPSCKGTREQEAAAVLFLNGVEAGQLMEIDFEHFAETELHQYHRFKATRNRVSSSIGRVVAGDAHCDFFCKTESLQRRASLHDDKDAPSSSEEASDPTVQERDPSSFGQTTETFVTRETPVRAGRRKRKEERMAVPSRAYMQKHQGLLSVSGNGFSPQEGTTGLSEEIDAGTDIVTSGFVAQALQRSAIEANCTSEKFSFWEEGEGGGEAVSVSKLFACAADYVIHSRKWHRLERFVSRQRRGPAVDLNDRRNFKPVEEMRRVKEGRKKQEKLLSQPELRGWRAGVTNKFCGVTKDGQGTEGKIAEKSNSPPTPPRWVEIPTQRKKGDEMTELRRRQVMEELEFQQKLRQVQERLLRKMGPSQECVETHQEYSRQEAQPYDVPQEFGKEQSIDDEPPRQLQEADLS